MNEFEVVKKLLEANRSYRRFDQTRPISHNILTKLVGLTRLCSSGRNLQPLRYRIVSDKNECDALFPSLKWAGYYTEWDGPAEGERPVAYLIQCLDTELTKDCLCDDGLQLEAITLGAAACGINNCIIKAFNTQSLADALGIDARFKPRYVLALGYGSEEIKLVDTDGSTDADIRYYRDKDGTHYVPKRPLDELIVK